MRPPFTRHRNSTYKPVLAWFSILVLLWTLLVFQAGGFTTSINAGMAFLDWPLSNGSLNPDGWLTESDKFAEHSHRLLATMEGVMTAVIALGLGLFESRRWLRQLGYTAIGLVVFQGVLGGLRVLFDPLNTASESYLAATIYRVAHACTAQVFLCVLVAIALASTRTWIEENGRLRRKPTRNLQRAGLVACWAVLIQLLLGALVRHNQAALAIPTFPLAGPHSLLPPAWNFPVTIHFLHRAMAVLVTLAVLWFAGRLWSARDAGSAFGAGAVWLVFLLALQIFLGALVIWSWRNPHAATAHVLTGAFVLASTWALTFLSHRYSFPLDSGPGSAGQVATELSRHPVRA